MTGDARMNLTYGSIIRIINLILYCRDSNRTAYEHLLYLEHHNDRRREDEPDLWEYHQTHVVDFIKQVILSYGVLELLHYNINNHTYMKKPYKKNSNSYDKIKFFEMLEILERYSKFCKNL